jgi:hypothetical protein
MINDARQAPAGFSAATKCFCTEHEWRVAEFVAFTAANETLPRIWLNPALRRHNSPRALPVQASVTWEFRLLDVATGEPLSSQESELFLPGWNGPSRLILHLGTNRVDLVVKFPFAEPTGSFDACVTNIEARLCHRLDRSCFRRVRLNADSTGYVERKLF